MTLWKYFCTYPLMEQRYSSTLGGRLGPKSSFFTLFCCVFGTPFLSNFVFLSSFLLLFSFRPFGCDFCFPALPCHGSDVWRALDVWHTSVRGLSSFPFLHMASCCMQFVCGSHFVCGFWGPCGWSTSSSYLQWVCESECFRRDPPGLQ